ncbi:pyrroloquinoline quinone-dependent dehydrogenase [Candidatus Marimicrobium litorale]|nr:pyrroloquinoline quinone-dependent dehydrogenase [Candidatus Marimicrobium litorale]
MRAGSDPGSAFVGSLDTGYISRMHTFLSSKLFAPLLSGIVATFLSACQPETINEPPPGVTADWPAYGGTPGGTHFSRANQITPDNVANLEVAWHHRSGDYREARKSGASRLAQSSMQVTPILVEDRLYYCSPFNRVISLDAETGAELWAFDPKVNMDNHPVLTHCRGVSSWRSNREGFCEHRIFVGTMDARLIALDANTGKPCPDFGNAGEIDTSEGMSEHQPAEYGITSPPAILGDKVITGSMVLDNQRTDSPGGIVRAYNARSGELEWVFNPVPPGGTARNEDGTWRSGTTNVWSIISVDETRGLVFLPTGNTTPDYFGGHRKGLDYYSSSVIALKGDSGEIAWHYQLVHHDLWDYDTPAQPTLVDLVVDEATVPVVVQVTKMGMTFVLHRETGQPVWPVEERPVPQEGAVEEEYLAPTQPFPSHIPPLIKGAYSADAAWGLTFWDRNACRDKIAGMRNDGIYTPPSLQGSVNYPSNAGGNNWGSPAINPDTGVMVVFTNRLASTGKLIPRAACEDNLQAQTGTPYCVETDWITSPLGLPCSAPPWGTLDAINLSTGETLWSVPLGTTRDMAPFPFWWIEGLPGMAAPMMTHSGLIFSGISNEHALRAFSAETGKELWQGELPTAANALPMTYQIRPGGKQYVVIAAGGHWSGGAPPGDHIIAFALPDQVPQR